MTFQPTSPTKSHVFISYSREDAREIVSRLEQDLNANGVDTWRDDQIRPGVPFAEELETAIDNSYAMLAVMSPNVRKSRWARSEWYYAISRSDVAIIPLVVNGFDEQVFPIELGTLNRLHLTEDYDSSLQDIIQLLKLAQENPLGR